MLILLVFMLIVRNKVILMSIVITIPPMKLIIKLLRLVITPLVLSIKISPPDYKAHYVRRRTHSAHYPAHSTCRHISYAHF